MGVVHAENLTVKWSEKVDWAFEEKWEKRRVYVIEGISKLPQYAYGKRVRLIDDESMLVPFSDTYDRSGELWKVWINHATRAALPSLRFPGEQAGITDEWFTVAALVAAGH